MAAQQINVCWVLDVLGNHKPAVCSSAKSSKPTKVVASGHRLSDADGGGTNRDDEHLVVA